MTPSPDAFMLTCPDPHHDGAYEWGWDGNQLWNRAVGQEWRPAWRVNVTPDRIRALHCLMRSRARQAKRVNKIRREQRRKQRKAAQ